MGNHNEFGKLGEQMATDFLLEHGYKICVRNYRYLKAEVDIIARKEGILAIVEVKSRNNRFLEDVSDAINQKKIKLLVTAANQYVVENNLDVEVRFDIITVIKKGGKLSVEHLKDAFYYF